MYTVVIADDEEEIRRSLIRKIDWKAIGFEVAGETDNGEDALELVEKLEPDLLLTDVKMPFVSGIELARQVREVRPATQIAFLSGYDDFSYAQQAIQYNIISYMLKPISSEELTKELLVIREKMEKKFGEFMREDAENQKMEKREFLFPLLLDGFRRELSGSEKEKLVDSAVACGLLDEKSKRIFRYAVIVTSITEEGCNCTGRGGVQAVDSILKKYVKYTSVYAQDKIISLLMATEAGFRKYLHIIVKDISQSVERVKGLECVIGVSRIAKHIAGVHECYLEAVNAMGYAKKSGGSIHFIGDEERMEPLDQELVQSTVKEIENLVRGGTAQEITEYLTRFFSEAGEGRITSIAADFILLQIVSSTFHVVYAAAGNEAVQKLQQKFSLYHNMRGLGGAEHMQAYIEICVAARELVAEQRKKSSEILCEKTLRMIDEKYMDPELSLAGVSAEIAVSPNYLSALVKKETGSTFKDLLTKRRIETARDLLLCTSMKIREIAEKCGYNDQHYFSYCFKKYTGNSPNNCRRSNEETKV